jgi:hypothetical protein
MMKMYGNKLLDGVVKLDEKFRWGNLSNKSQDAKPDPGEFLYQA